MDEIRNKIIEILKDNFKIENISDDEEFFHRLDSINYIRYILIIENVFSVNVTIKDSIRSINETLDFLKKNVNS